jgi:hypothetical protein
MIDKKRVIKYLDNLDNKNISVVKKVIQEMFVE